MRAFVLVVVLAFLAGCTEDAPPGPLAGVDGDATGTVGPRQPGPGRGSTSTSGAPQPSSPPVVENQAPVATLDAAPLSGQAPLVVTFRLHGSDGDGDALAWALDTDGDGTDDLTGEGLPVQRQVTYPEVGEFLVRLTVTDGKASGVDAATVSALGEETVRPQPFDVQGSTFRVATACQEEFHGLESDDMVGWTYVLEHGELMTGSAYVVFERVDGSNLQPEAGTSGTVAEPIVGAKACTTLDAQGQVIEYTIHFSPP